VPPWRGRRGSPGNQYLITRYVPSSRGLEAPLGQEFVRFWDGLSCTLYLFLWLCPYFGFLSVWVSFGLISWRSVPHRNYFSRFKKGGKRGGGSKLYIKDRYHEPNRCRPRKLSDTNPRIPKFHSRLITNKHITRHQVKMYRVPSTVVIKCIQSDTRWWPRRSTGTATESPIY